LPCRILASVIVASLTAITDRALSGMSARVSVIIPTYNRAKLLMRALNSVARQTRPADEIIVVDDGSTDHTADMIARHYPNVVYLKQENKGVSAARNRGIRAATGEWMAFLDSDDEWLDQKLETQIDQLYANATSSTADGLADLPQQAGIFNLQYKICHTEEIWYRKGRRVNQKKKHEKAGGHIFRRCLPLCCISPSSVIIHRTIFENIGLFDEALPACEDYDLWLRVCAAYPVLYIEEPLIAKYGGHADQLSQRYWGMDRFRIYALEKIIRSNGLTNSNRRAATQMILAKLAIYLTGLQKRNRDEEITVYQAKRRYYADLLVSLNQE